MFSFGTSVITLISISRSFHCHPITTADPKRRSSQLRYRLRLLNVDSSPVQLRQPQFTHFTMLPSLCWLAFPLSVLASSSSRVLVFDTDRKAPSDRTQPDRVSGRAAQNFISHRLGLDRFQTIEEDDVDSTISLISRFGGSVQKPFGPSDKRVEPVKALIIIESVESPESEFG